MTVYMFVDPFSESLLTCQELFGVSGVNMVLGYLQPDAGQARAVPEWGLLLSAAVDCAWFVTRYNILTDLS